MAFSPDGKHLASAGSDGTVRVWETASGTQVHTFQGHIGAIWTVAFSPDGQRLASAGYNDRTVRVWETASGKEVLVLKGHSGTVHSVTFSPDGQRLASAGYNDRTARLWETNSGKQVLIKHTYHVNSVAFSPDGQRLASAGADGTVRLWETASGKEVLVLKGHTSSVSSVAFSPEGQRLASVGTDFTVRLWEAASGKEVLALKHNYSVYSVAFSPDGQRLASAGADGTVRLWETVHVPLSILHQRALSAQSLDLVESLFTIHVRQADVLQALRDHPRLTASLRQAALTLAEQVRLDPQPLNNASWAVVCQPGASADAYRHARLQAEEAYRLEPENESFVNTLGVAQYRSGQYPAAVETLARCSERLQVPSDSRLRRAIPGRSYPANLAFLSMAQHQLGQKELEQATLTRLRQAVTKPPWAEDAESGAFLREAEALIEGKAPDPR